MKLSSTLPIPSTIFDRWLARTGVSGSATIFCMVMAFLIFFILGVSLDNYLPQLLDGFLFRVFEGDLLRNIFLAPTIIIYVLAAQHILRPTRISVIEVFGRMMAMSEDEYHRRVLQLSPLHRKGEWLALAAGLAVGLVLPIDWGVPSEFSWTNRYISVLSWMMFALAGWSVYSSLAVARLITKLHYLPLTIDLFDPIFLAPVARRSLAEAIAFTSAITLSVIFMPTRTLRTPYFIAIYAMLILLTVVTFFLSMRTSHRLMILTKKRELRIVRRHLTQSYESLKTQNEPTQTIPTRSDWVTAWLAYEKRIEQAPEWPFNIDTLRNLSASVLIPSVAAVTRFLTGR